VTSPFLAELDRWGPDAVAAKTPAPAEAALYTRRIARSHYENFPVVTWLLPRKLHQHFYNVYAFCRWADDLGDEIGDRARSLELLAWWRTGVERMYAGQGTHPVFVALAGTVNEHHLPRQLFLDLIHAFEQDQRAGSYRTFDELLDYCRYSANPVGRLVLRLWGYADAELDRLSDATCTALQLTNFWQDVARDADISRVYIPGDVMASHGYSAKALRGDLGRGVASREFKAALRDLVERTHELFAVGLPLVGQVEPRLAVDLDLFSRGGLAVLRKIEKQDYDTISRRPKLGKLDRAALMTKALGRMLLRGSRPGREAQHAFR
jgi:squalene synthase HpnC